MSKEVAAAILAQTIVTTNKAYQETLRGFEANESGMQAAANWLGNLFRACLHAVELR